MGLFSRKGAAATAPPPAPAQIVVGDDDMAAAHRVLDDVVRAQVDRSDGATRAAILGFARAGSLPGSPVFARSEQDYMVQMVMAVGKDGRGPTGAERPWQWLAAVVEEAERRGDVLLVARASYLAQFWLSVSPNLTINDEQEIRLHRGVPAASLARLLGVALRVLPTVDPDAVVVPDGQGDGIAMTVGLCWQGSLQQAREIRGSLSPDVVAIVDRAAG